jgi:predicted porin
MKKTLIALAVLAASGGSFAQSNVTLSGGYGLAFGSTKTGATSTGNQIARQTGNLNFAGSEDLGGGLKAGFQLQTSIGAHAATSLNVTGAAASATTLGDRGANVTLSGGFGTAFIGRGASAVRSLWGAVGDVSQMPIVSGLSAGSSVGSNADKGGDVNARVIYGDAYSNYVAYATPAFNGLTASIAMAAVDGSTFATKDTLSYSLNYANGPLAVGFNLTDSKQIAAGQTAAQGSGADADKGYIPAIGAYKMNTVAASYDLGMAKVGVTYQTISLATGTNPGDATALTANIPMGAGSIGLGYGKRAASTTSEVAFGDEVKQTFVGYRHNLSKRTNVSVYSNKINRQGATTTADVTETHLVVAHTF